MTTNVQVIPLAGLVLDPDGPLLRDHVRKPHRHTPHYLERYDRTTLFYDCVHLSERGSYLFTAPRFLNLWDPFRDGLRIGGTRPKRIRRRKWLRCEQIEVFAPEGEVSVEIGGTRHVIAARQGLAPGFAGTNALVSMNKNNALPWIRDWASYYARAHGANAAVLFDNGSTDYTVQDLADTLTEVPGIDRAVVFSAPYPYGPTDRSNKLEISPRFFQTSMLNIARRDPLARARAVLNVDIDEIARSHTGARIFDLAVQHRLGMATIQGSWVYPAPGTDGAADHADHIWRRVPDRKCNRKWCLRPGGVMDRFGWAVHQIGGILQNLFTDQDEVGLLHCHATSTGWKAKRLNLPTPLDRDPDLADFMAKAFPRDVS
ncbi:MAG: hypothetical protein ACK5IB_07000 [Qingshengfaniella sp.]